MDPLRQLHAAADAGDTSGIVAALAAGAAVDGTLPPLPFTPLYRACAGGHEACAVLLLGAGADPNGTSSTSLFRPIHAAVHSAALVARLLAAGARASRKPGVLDAPLSNALRGGQLDIIRLLIRAAPEVVSHSFSSLSLMAVSASNSKTPAATLRCVLEELPAADARKVLAYLLHSSSRALALLPTLAARLALSPAESAQVPSPCPGLGAALPAVLRRSEEEAALVCHLPADHRQRLRTFALSLAQAQQRCLLPPLPPPIVARVLALSVA